MIPKVIHYCWFGNSPLPPLAEKCINSWKQYCPDYAIKEWNEHNINISECPLFVREAYSRKKWAFVTDYIRLKVVYEQGGIYLDTDVELIASLNPLLAHRAYVGCEGSMYINTGLGFGAEAGFPFFRENMRIYEELNPIDIHGNFVCSPCPHYTTKLLNQANILFPINTITEASEGLTIYPNVFFNPYDWKTKTLTITHNTYSIHHYSGSWMSPLQKKALLEKDQLDIIRKKYGNFAAKCYDYYFWSKKENGGPGLIQKILRKRR